MRKSTHPRRPRKTGAQGNMFDVIASCRAECGRVHIAVDSCKFLGADHGMVLRHVLLGASENRGKRFDTRPRIVKQALPDTTHIHDHALQNMAKICTAIPQGTADKDSAHPLALHP